MKVVLSLYLAGFLLVVFLLLFIRLLASIPDISTDYFSSLFSYPVSILLYVLNKIVSFHIYGLTIIAGALFICLICKSIISIKYYAYLAAFSAISLFIYSYLLSIYFIAEEFGAGFVFILFSLPIYMGVFFPLISLIYLIASPFKKVFGKIDNIFGLKTLSLVKFIWAIFIGVFSLAVFIVSFLAFFSTFAPLVGMLAKLLSREWADFFTLFSIGLAFIFLSVAIGTLEKEHNMKIFKS